MNLNCHTSTIFFVLALKVGKLWITRWGSLSCYASSFFLVPALTVGGLWTSMLPSSNKRST